MKLSIKSGPRGASGVDYGFVLSYSRLKEISDFFLDWCNSLPKEVSNHIEVIIINPTCLLSGILEQISIEIVLSGNYLHYNQDGGKETMSWKNQIEEIIFCLPPHDTALTGTKSLCGLNMDLNKKIRLAIEAEIKTYQPLLSELNSMFESMSVRY